jgi:hypothetical protein
MVLTRPPCLMELTYIVATLAKAMRQNVQGKIFPALFFVFGFPVAASTEIV